MTYLIDRWSHYFVSLPTLAKFAVGMAIIVGAPRLSRRVRLRAVVGLLLSGVVIGPRAESPVTEQGTFEFLRASSALFRHVDYCGR